MELCRGREAPEIAGNFWDGGDLMLVHPGGLEPPTLGLGNPCSIRLSYGCLGDAKHNAGGLRRLPRPQPIEPPYSRPPVNAANPGCSRRRIVSSRRGPVETNSTGASSSSSIVRT